MKNFGETITISFNWWRNDGKNIKKEHLDALSESAKDRIFNQLQEGITSGELHDNIHMTNKDPQDGISYTGWYEINTVSN